MKILITGIAGFAGSHLTDYILATQHSELSGIVRDSRDCKNIADHASSIRLHEGDITNLDFLLKTVGDLKPDIIFHLAAQAHIPSGQTLASETFKVNTLGTVNLLESVKLKSPDSKVLIVSSGAIYGEVFDERRLPTEQSPFHPQDLYTAGKAACDHIAQAYKRSFDLNVFIARPFNHTGPRQDPSYVCSSIAKQFAEIKKKTRPTRLRLGNVDARRDFSDVRDVVRAYWLITQQSQHSIFNVCSGTIVSIRQIIGMLEEISGIDVELETDKNHLRKSDINLIAGNCDLLKSATSWRPKFSMTQTLTDLYHFHLNE